MPTVRTAMTMPPLRIPSASEARSASLTTCLHHRRLITLNRLLLSEHGVCPMVSQSVATRSRLKRMRRKRKRKNPRDLLQNNRCLKGRRVGRGNLRQRRKSGGISSNATDKVCALERYRISSLLIHFDYSGAEMPSTEKGLVDPIAGEERVFDTREPEITRGPREHTRGAFSTYCRGPLTSCWRHSQCTTKCTPGQRERQFTSYSEL